jgi:hypothetical protein
VAGFCEHGNEPSGSMKKAGCCLKIWVTISFSKDILHHGAVEDVGEFMGT